MKYYVKKGHIDKLCRISSNFNINNLKAVKRLSSDAKSGLVKVTRATSMFVFF